MWPFKNRNKTADLDVERVEYVNKPAWWLVAQQRSFRFFEAAGYYQLHTGWRKQDPTKSRKGRSYASKLSRVGGRMAKNPNV